MNDVLNFALSFWVGLAVLIIIIVKQSVKFVPQNTAYVIERFGKYNTTMIAGLNLLIPFIDKIAYERSLKEMAVDVPSQSAITRDNISLVVDGVLYLKVIDPYKASYGIVDYVYAVTQLAQTTMRSEIGKIELDKTFEEREVLNINIVASINEAAVPWGVQVLRYEIKDIEPPRTVLDAMERQMKAERDKRASILESEGERQSAINVAEGDKQAKVLSAEGDKAQQILRAEGEAQAILAVANAKAEALKVIGNIAIEETGQKAIQLDLASQAIQAKAAIAKKSSVVLLSDEKTGASNIVAEAMTIINSINKHQSGGDAS